MCGIVGFYNKLGGSDSSSRNIAVKMASAIKHRGPDDSGVWLGESNRLALAHQRLSILDISAAGHQPMISSNGRYILVFNGEIYNHQEIKDSLINDFWKGESDTEILLEAIAQWGLVKTLKKCSGMFAFAVWDKNLKRLSLVRDRFGEKPLYYGWCNDVFIFGSELKSLKIHPSFQPNINMDAVSLYFNHGYIPAPFSIYKGISKLSPGSILHFNPNLADCNATSEEKYWSLEEITSEFKLSKPIYIKKDDALDELEKRLTLAVTRQSISDVPLGSLLSGGIDSSLITAILQKNSNQKIKSFSLGFNEKQYNEAEHAKLVAEHIGTEHHEFIVTPNDLQNIIPKLAKIYDEPFGDPSAIPTFIVSQFARSKVTVALTGDGGDELFGGYNHYHRSAQIWSSIRRVPSSIRTISASILNPIGVSMYNTSFGRKAERLSNYLSCQSLFDCYKVQTQASRYELKNMLGITERISGTKICKSLDSYEAMMYSDAMTYLPDDILVKVDRASMAVSLETRAPFLDHDVAEFAFKLPLEYKINDGNGKLILRDLLSRYMPKHLFDRPKMGFGVPVGTWINGPLKDWADSLLTEEKLNRDGLLNAELIRDRWLAHQNGSANWDSFLWSVLMFVLWMDSQ